MTCLKTLVISKQNEVLWKQTLFTWREHGAGDDNNDFVLYKMKHCLTGEGDHFRPKIPLMILYIIRAH